MIKLAELLDEKHLTPAEIAKKEDILKAMKKSGTKLTPREYAIATAKAEKIAEEQENKYSEYSNDALTDMIVNLSRYKDTEDVIDSIKKELERRKSNLKENMDHEASMAKGELRDMLIHGAKLYQIIEPGDELPGWVSAYITLASDYIHSVSEYMTEKEVEAEEYE